MKVRRGAKIGMSAVVLSTLVVGVSSGASAGAAPARKQAESLPAAELAIVAYSTPQAAYEGIIPAFQKTKIGKNITFTQSYGASGDQSRAVAAGQPADIVEFSLEPDVTRLVDAGIVSPSWNKNKYKGFVTNSVAVIVTRKGDPKKLKTWGSLTKSGVEVITPNPATSGSARWNVMGGYGAISNVGAKNAAGVTYLNKLFKNVPVQPDSGRAALQTFAGGKGDALLSYENEAIFANQNGQSLSYTIPSKTILIQNPVAVSAKSSHPKQAKAFLKFLYSKAAQKIFAANGYRPVVSGVVKANKFPTPKGLFTIDDLGGWPAVTDKFFDPDTGIVTQIERNNGVATTK
jgi:sulfate/thiosulfate transport system substrate-binding protein